MMFISSKILETLFRVENLQVQKFRLANFLNSKSPRKGTLEKSFFEFLNIFPRFLVNILAIGTTKNGKYAVIQLILVI